MMSNATKTVRGRKVAVRKARAVSDSSWHSPEEVLRASLPAQRVENKRAKAVAVAFKVLKKVFTRRMDLAALTRVGPTVTLQQAALDADYVQRVHSALSSEQQAELVAARVRAVARLKRSDMTPEALRARERAGAEWEAQHGPVTAFAGARRGR